MLTLEMLTLHRKDGTVDMGQTTWGMDRCTIHHCDACIHPMLTLEMLSIHRKDGTEKMGQQTWGMGDG